MSTNRDPDQAFQELIDEPDKTIKTIVRHVAAGGTLPGLCDIWRVRYGDVIAWLQEDRELHEKYSDAVNARSEWAKEQVFEESRRIAMSRMVDFFGDDGTIKKSSEWTSEMKALVKKIKYNDDGEIEMIEFWDKQKSIDFLGKNMDMLTETHSINGKFSLEDLIQASREDKDGK